MLTLLWSIAHGAPDTPAGTPEPSQEVIWPNDRDVTPRDAVIYVQDNQRGLPDPPLTRDDGSVVSVTSHAMDGVLGRSYRVLVPDEELAPGVYVIVIDGVSATFTVVDQLAEVATAPVP